jgi:bifunctional NMN adenylyltransferase/nudix hydrolase
MKIKFPITLVIGRFQPFHKGHLNLVRKALKRGDKTIVLLGSGDQERTAKNTWSVDERLSMIKPCFTPEELGKLIFLSIPDYPSNEAWVAHVERVLSQYGPQEKKSICLIGYVKDETSYYLRLFPQWSFVQTEKFCKGLSATDIRRSYFEGSPPDPRYLPDPVIEFLCDFRKHKDYQKISILLSEDIKIASRVAIIRG